MKLRNLLVIAAVVLLATSVAFGQIASAGYTTTTVTCIGATAGAPVAPATPACSVDGQTLLVANFVEGLTLTVPNQINFSLVPGYKAAGSQELTAVTTWFLDTSYTDIWVDAFFKDAVNTMTPSDPAMGMAIPATAILAQQNGGGGTSPFDITKALANPLDPITWEPDVMALFPIKNIQLAGSTQVTTINGTSTGFVGQDSSYLNLWIDFTPSGPLYNGAGVPLINPSGAGTWSGLVFVRAQAY